MAGSNQYTAVKLQPARPSREGERCGNRRVYVDEGETTSMSEEAASVAGIYLALRNDVNLTTPDFEHAVR